MNSASKRLISLVLLVFLLGAWFITLGPHQIGGPAGYILVHGPSMEPRLYTGDLVITRSEERYSTGDVIAYRVPKGEQGEGRIVIHRIIGGDSETGFETQGDNKEAPDIWRPRPDDVIGSQWVHLPNVGEFLNYATENLGVAVVALAGMTAIGGRKMRKHRNGGGHRMDAHKEARGSTPLDLFLAAPLWSQVGLVACIVSAVGLVTLAAVAFSSETRNTQFAESANFEQRMDFEYSANVIPSTLYPSGRVGPIKAPPGSAPAEVQPPALYTRLTKSIDLQYAYKVDGPGLTDVSGSIRAELEVTANGKGGWTTTQELSPPSAFTGNEVSGSVSLALAPINQLITNVEAETEFKPTSYSVTARMVTDVKGMAGGAPVQETFVQPFSFDIAEATLIPSASLSRSQERSIGENVERAGQIDVGATKLGVIAARALAAPLAVIAALATIALAIAILSGLGRSKEARVGARFGTRFVSVADRAFENAEVVQMTSLEDLAVLAQRDGRIIFNKRQEDGDLYFVPDGPLLYQYTAPVQSAPSEEA